MECICNSCLNLKSKIGDIEGEIEYTCEFEFPSESCEECEADGCDATCDNYICDNRNMVEKTVSCKNCGKQLHQVCSEDSEEVYCIDCYLKNC